MGTRQETSRKAFPVIQRSVPGATELCGAVKKGTADMLGIVFNIYSYGKSDASVSQAGPLDSRIVTGE